MAIIEVPDISVVNTVDGNKRLFSLRDQKIKKDGALHAFGAGSGVKHNGDLYVLGGDVVPLARMICDSTDIGLGFQGSGIEVDWGDGSRNGEHRHTYSDGLEEHEIVMYGKCDSITTLSLPTNGSLVSVDVLKNTELKQFLQSTGGNLTSLSFTECPKLNYIDCKNNQLTSLKLGEHPDLYYIDCSGNMLTSLDFSDRNVTTIICYNNRLISLKLYRCVELECQNNYLTSLDVSTCIAMNNFDCSGNQLTSLDVSTCIAMNNFDCSGNQLTSLDVSKCRMLNYFSCANNKLTSLRAFGNTMGNSIQNYICQGNPFINDQAELTAFANSLQDRTDKLGGVLLIDNAASALWINEICGAKNWKVL